MKNRLLGELIGLARCTDGNEHLINPSATAMLVEALSVVQTGSADIAQLLSRVEEEKRKMVPDCFLCASPCGKNSAYPVEQLLEAPMEIRVLKEQLMQGIQLLATHFTNDSEVKLCGCDWELFLYKALIIIGMDFLTEEHLRGYLSEMEQLFQKYDID